MYLKKTDFTANYSLNKPIRIRVWLVTNMWSCSEFQDAFHIISTYFFDIHMHEGVSQRSDGKDCDFLFKFMYRNASS